MGRGEGNLLSHCWTARGSVSSIPSRTVSHCACKALALAIPSIHPHLIPTPIQSPPSPIKPTPTRKKKTHLHKTHPDHFIPIPSPPHRKISPMFTKKKRPYSPEPSPAHPRNKQTNRDNSHMRNNPQRRLDAIPTQPVKISVCISRFCL